MTNDIEGFIRDLEQEAFGTEPPDPDDRLPADKQAQVNAAVDLLNREGARILKREGAYQIGVWRDTPSIRLALKALDMDRLPLVRMDQQDHDTA